MKDNIKIFGNINVREFYIVSQDSEIELNEYFMIEDGENSSPVEVVEVFISPMCISGMMPIDVPESYIEMLGLSKDKPTRFAKVKVLNHLSKPIMATHVRRATFEDVKHLLITSKNLDHSLVLGGIVGTNLMYENTPSEYKGISPMFENGNIVEQKTVPFIIDPSKQQEYPHTGFFGGSGSGKSYGLNDYCEELMSQGIPALALDPHHEMDFNSSFEGFDKEYQDRNEIFTIGSGVNEIGIKFTELNISELCRLFEFMDGLTEPQRASLEAIYSKGMTSVALESNLNKIKEIVAIKESSKHPNEFRVHMSDLASKDMNLYDLYTKNENKISTLSSLQALSWKLSKLLNTRIFNTSGVERVEKSLLQSKLCIIRGNIRELQMVSSYLINKVYSKRRAYQDSLNKKSSYGQEVDFFPMFCVIVDEAHNFAPNGSDAKMSPTKSVLKTIAQEARKYGVFEVMCTQRIGLLDTTIVAQMNTKFIFRTTNALDLETIKKECNLTDEEMLLLPDFPSGHCIVTSPTLPKNFNIKFRAGYTKTPHRVDCFEELRKYNEENIYDSNEIIEKCVYRFLDEHGKIDSKRGYPGMIMEIEKATNREVDKEFLLSFLDKMDRIGKIRKKDTIMGPVYEPVMK